LIGGFTIALTFCWPYQALLSRNGYFILATMMKITRMNQTCPHCQASVNLPKLVSNYSDSQSSAKIVEICFSAGKTRDGVVQHRC
jgi:hypothetical protein